MGRAAPAGLCLFAVAALLHGCGGGAGSTAGGEVGAPAPAPDAIRVPPLRDRVVGLEQLRRAVLRGVGRDYLAGTQVGPPSFGLCLQRGLRSALDERNLRALALVYRRPAGQQFTAQALTDLAAPIGSRCGGRRFVPMLIEASMAFRAGRLQPSLRAYASDRYAFEGRLPPGWQRAGSPLVPLISPREVLSVGTFPMPAGGGGNCGREPVVAIRRMRPGDVLVSIQEYLVTKRMRPEFTRTFPPKAEQLELDELRPGRVARAAKAPHDRGVAVTWATVPFSEAGRAFDALVYFRGRPSAGLRRQASRILGELVFEKLRRASRPG